jgi:hypothetical protein
LKKRTKKLLHIGPGFSGEAQPRIQKFFASFFQKTSAFFLSPYLPATPLTDPTPVQESQPLAARNPA